LKLGYYLTRGRFVSKITHDKSKISIALQKNKNKNHE
jgi:hypothetical protein